jgi:biopolymer transport protein ExbD
MQRPARLNLVALMDIFTILVLFLMVNNGDVEVLQADRSITLPESISEQRPEESLTIKVNPQEILVQGRPVGSVIDALAEEDGMITALQAELQHHASRAGPLEGEKAARGRSVIIMGDQTMPYELLQRIMSTCASEDYRDISLAVSNVAEPALSPETVVREDT